MSGDISFWNIENKKIKYSIKSDTGMIFNIDFSRACAEDTIGGKYFLSSHSRTNNCVNIWKSSTREKLFMYPDYFYGTFIKGSDTIAVINKKQSVEDIKMERKKEQRDMLCNLW